MHKVRAYPHSQAHLSNRFDDILHHLLHQIWFYELDSFDEKEVVEDEHLFSLIEVYELEERIAYTKALFKFTSNLHEVFETYRVEPRLIKTYLIRSGSFDKKRDVLFFESIESLTQTF